METKANYVVVGAFTLIVVAACFGFILWVGGFTQSSEQVPLQVKIRGSATGLTTGSQLLFNGVKVGAVVKTSLDVDDPNLVIAHVMINRYAPLREDTKATIGVQGLTGTATIDLTGGSLSSPNLLDAAHDAGTVATINATPSSLSDLLASAQSIATRVDKVVTIIEEVAVKNKTTLNKTLSNVEAVTQTVADNRENIASFLKGAGAVAKTVESLSHKIDGTIKAVEGIVEAVVPEDVTKIISNVEDFTGKLTVSTEKLDETISKVDGLVSAIKPIDVETIVGNVKQLTVDLQDVSTKFEGTLGKVDGVLDAVDSEKVAATIDNVSKAANTAKIAIDEIAKTAKVVGDSNEDVKAIVANVKSMTSKLDKASSKVEGVLVSLDGLLGSDDTKGLMSDASSTILEYRKLAKQLQARVDTISRSIEDFSNRGLKEVRSLVNTSERAIQSIEQTITKVGDNPSSILSGSSQVREYKGRPRR